MISEEARSPRKACGNSGPNERQVPFFKSSAQIKNTSSKLTFLNGGIRLVPIFFPSGVKRRKMAFFLFLLFSCFMLPEIVTESKTASLLAMCAWCSCDIALYNARIVVCEKQWCGFGEQWVWLAHESLCSFFRAWHMPQSVTNFYHSTCFCNIKFELSRRSI